MKTIKIRASKQYEVMIGQGLLADVSKILKLKGLAGRMCIITDRKVSALYGKDLLTSLRKAGCECEMFVTEGGEESKSGEEYLRILEFLAQRSYTRSDIIIALGGGVVGDLAGFVASTYLRGVRLVQIPTTLLAFVDSSVGGKTAINLKSGKNLVGAFYQPNLVICDIDCAKTLSKEDFACGMAEVIKYGMLFDLELLDLIEDGMDNNAEEIIAKCVSLKKAVVEKDEKDIGERQLLNFGHTLGHAIEKETNYAVMHGQAVAIGMHLITARALKKGLCGKEVLLKLITLLDKYNLPLKTDIPMERLIKRTEVDKKRSRKGLTVVLPTQELGKCELKVMTAKEWVEFLVG